MPVPENQPERVRQQVVNWSAVMAFIADWTIAIVSYIFFVLLSGLIFGMLGGYADGIFLFIHEEWVGSGRQVGWILGTVTAVIGIPLGWVRPNDKKFSFPTPRDLRRSIAVKARKRRQEKKKQREEEDDVCSLTGIFEGACVVSTIGIIFGFVIGMYLMVCWFSLALSPLAAGGWLETFDSSDISMGGGSVSSSDSFVFALVLVPSVALGGLGFGISSFVLSFLYLRYLRSTPPDIRAENRRQAREALRKKKAHWYMVAIGVVLTLTGGGLSAFSAYQLVEATASRHWPLVPGQIVESKVDSHENSDGETKHTARVVYRYEVGQSSYSGDRVSIGLFGQGSAGKPAKVVRRYPLGKSVHVHANPSQPRRSVLEPGPSLASYLFLGFSLLPLMIGLWVNVNWLKRWFARTVRN